MKTELEILNEHIDFSKDGVVDREEIVKAMRVFADQQTKDLEDQLEQSVHNDVCTGFMEQAINLRKALEEAKEVIRLFHGPVAWEIYDKHSPEMKRLNTAIENAPSFELEKTIEQQFKSGVLKSIKKHRHGS